MMRRVNNQLPEKQIADFYQRWKVVEFSLFGSVVGEDFQPDSDVDVLVNFAPEARWSLFDLVSMQDELKEIFGREVDLVEREGLVNPFRRHAILSSRKVIYEATRA
jgi:predicted nucleotidyltransferase